MSFARDIYSTDTFDDCLVDLLVPIIATTSCYLRLWTSGRDSEILGIGVNPVLIVLPGGHETRAYGEPDAMNTFEEKRLPHLLTEIYAISSINDYGPPGN